MNALLRIGLLVCTAAAVVPAQFQSQAPKDLKIGLSEEWTEPSTWTFVTNALGQEDEEKPYAALMLETDAGGACMVLAHVVPDPLHPQHAGLLEAWRILYPFLELPNPTWTLGQLPATGIVGWEFMNPATSPLVIPPARVMSAVTALRDSGYNYLLFGMAGTGVESLFEMPATVATTNGADERFYHSAWLPSRDVFDANNFSRRAFDVAVNRYYSGNPNQRQLESLRTLFEKSYRWQIQLQVVQVHRKAPGANEPRIKVSRPTLWKRRTLGAETGPEDQEWARVIGPRLELPLLTNDPLLPDHVVSTGMPTKLTEVTLLTPTNRHDIYAHFPLVGGGWASVQRVHEWPGIEILHPVYQATALFLLPANATSGVCYLSGDPEASPPEWIPTKRPALGVPYPPVEGEPVLPTYYHASFNLLVVPLQ